MYNPNAKSLAGQFQSYMNADKLNEQSRSGAAMPTVQQPPQQQSLGIDPFVLNYLNSMGSGYKNYTQSMASNPALSIQSRLSGQSVEPSNQGFANYVAQNSGAGSK